MDSTDTCGTTIITQATDEELFAQMAKGGYAGRGAWAEVYRRYVVDLYNLLFRLRDIPQASVPGLVQQTMIRAYEHAHAFRAGDVTDTEAEHNRTLAWLCKIARNLHSSIRRQQVPISPLPQQGDETDSELSTKGRRLTRGELQQEIKHVESIVSGNGDDEYIPPRKRLLCEALDSLSDMDRDIVTATLDYLPYRLPKAVSGEICRRYNINRAYLRKRRERAFKKIKQYVSKHMSAENERHEKENGSEQ